MTAEHIQNSDQRIEDHFEDVLDMADSPVLISLKLNPDHHPDHQINYENNYENILQNIF